MNMTDEEQRKIFADNLKRYLKNTEQIKVCADLDIKTSTFNQWVKGKAIPRVSEIRKLADYFNIGVSDLVNAPVDIEKASYEEKEIIRMYRGLNKNRKKDIYDYTRMIYQKEKTDATNEGSA